MRKYHKPYYDDATVERVLMQGHWFVDEMCTTAELSLSEWSGYSTGVIYYDLLEKLPKVDPDLGEEARIVLDLNREDAQRIVTVVATKKERKSYSKERDSVVSYTASFFLTKSFFFTGIKKSVPIIIGK